MFGVDGGGGPGLLRLARSDCCLTSIIVLQTRHYWIAIRHVGALPDQPFGKLTAAERVPGRGIRVNRSGRRYQLLVVTATPTDVEVEVAGESAVFV